MTMADERKPDPIPDDAIVRPAGGDADRDDEFDTEETELVAYLDGELNEADARRIEAHLARDPQARAKALALKKTYDLLEYLPRPEPSPNFASRTLDRIPTSKSAPSPALSSPSPRGALAASHGSAPSATPLSPVSSYALASPPARWRPWLVGGAFAVILAMGLGYFGDAAVRSYLHPPDTSLSFEESRLVENLPLYSGVDDYDFLVKLADSDKFAPDAVLLGMPSVVAPAAVVQAAASQPWGNDHKLADAFKALPTARQDQLRDLDRKLYSQSPAERARLYQVLESYAVWLHGLDEPERKAILDAASPALRLAKIHSIREHLWQQQLPATLRNLLDKAENDQKRADLIQQWKTEEQDRRRNWMLARQNWETIRAGRVPWPFDNEAMKNEVNEFIRSVLRIDGNSSGRVTPTEAQMLREAREFAEKNNAWLWYGSDLYYLANKYPALPEPIGTPITRIEDLSKFAKKLTDRKNLRDAQGKWPEFALMIAEDAARAKLTLPFSLGPSRPGEFRPPIEAFLTKTLLPRLTPAERDILKSLEGKWPEYPRKMLDLARKHDLPVPGITLPGSPRKWENTYQPSRPLTRPN